MRKSAGILLYKYREEHLMVFLVHPGGPFWKNKDAGAWTIPKGEFAEDEYPLQAAVREFKEETGTTISGTFIELSPVKQKGGKLIYAWAVEGNIDAATLHSNSFNLEWPPQSGKLLSVPKVDKGDWFFITEANQKINSAQKALLEELVEKIR